MNRKEVAEQLKHVIQNQVNLIPEDYFALDEAIKELEKCCANCKSSFVDIHHKTGKLKYSCWKSNSAEPDYFEPTHFCTFHENKGE